MAYQVLARKYRPQTFAEVIGQGHVTKALRQSLASGRAGHAFIFAGPRGVGKTTSARILAKALNCEKPQAGEPCNKCSNCTDINTGAALDIIEIDAASYTGVDNIRELREQAMLVPVRAARKIFILDEAHMLSTGAFNAFLKILEEPPAHVAFILATTESAKLPATIVSRCQRFHFRRVGVAELAELLRDLAGREKIKIDDEALYLIARGVDGCVRDAESALEQVLSFAGGEKITAAVVSAALGVVPQALALELFAAVLADDGRALLDLLDRSDREGHDPVRLAEALIVLARLGLLLRLGVKADDIREASEETLAQVGKLSADLDAARMARLLDALLGAVQRMKRQEEHATALLEVALLRAAREALLPALPELVAEVKALRAGGAGPVAVAPGTASGRGAEKSDKSASSRPGKSGGSAAPDPAAASRPAGPGVDSRPAVPGWWPALLAALRGESRQLHALLSDATITGYSATELVLSFPPGKAFHAQKTEAQRALLEGLIRKVGREKLALRVASGVPPSGGAANRPAPAPGGPAPAPPPAPVADPLLQQMQKMFGGTVEQIDD